MDARERKEIVSSMIMDYLERNPEAADTVQGIAQWWIKQEEIQISIEEVGEVLEDLIAKKIIERLKLNGDYLFKIQR